MNKEDTISQNPDYIELKIGEIEAAAITRAANPFLPNDNADQVICEPSGLIGVLDGAGKANPASSIARKQFHAEFVRRPQSIKVVENGLLRGFSRAMEEVQSAEELEAARGIRKITYMTTATVAQAYQIKGERFMSVLHLGDSRFIGMKWKGNPTRTADQSKVYKGLQEGEITTAQALIFQYFIDEIVDTEDLNKYISIYGTDLGAPNDMNEESNWRANGAFSVGEFVNDRKVLGNAIKSRKEYRINSFPECFTIPLDEYYAIAIMTDGFTDNITTSVILSNLEPLQIPSEKPGEAIRRMEHLAQNAKYPKKNIDDRSMVVLKI